MKTENKDVRIHKGIKFLIELAKAIEDLPSIEGRTFSAKVLKLLEIGLERYRWEREIIKEFDRKREVTKDARGGKQVLSEEQISIQQSSEEDN